MSFLYKPEGYTSVSPYLIVTEASQTIDFLEQVFEAVELQRIPVPGPSGRLLHAEVRVDDTVLMLADAAADWPELNAHVHVYVPDVEATYQRAIQAGAISVQEPLKKEAADKRGGVRDRYGTTWWIATKVE